MGLFDSKNSKIRKSHLLSMITLAAADGEIDEREMYIISLAGKRIGMSESEINSAVENPEKVKFILPDDMKERFMQLFDFVNIMMVDGVIEQNELDYCINMAIKMGFRPTAVNDLVHQITEAIKKGREKEKVASEVDEWISQN